LSFESTTPVKAWELMSIGLPGNSTNPKVKEAEKETISMAIKKVIRLRVKLDLLIRDCTKSIHKYIKMWKHDFISLVILILY